MENEAEELSRGQAMEDSCRPCERFLSSSPKQNHEGFLIRWKQKRQVHCMIRLAMSMLLRSAEEI